MGKDTGRQPKKSRLPRIRNSLRAQVGLIVLLSYLLPVLLLGVFTGSLLLHKLEDQTQTAIASGAEQAWTPRFESLRGFLFCSDEGSCPFVSRKEGWSS